MNFCFCFTVCGLDDSHRIGVVGVVKHTLFVVGGERFRSDGHHDDVRKILGGVDGVDIDIGPNDNLLFLLEHCGPLLPDMLSKWYR